MTRGDGAAGPGGARGTRRDEQLGPSHLECRGPSATYQVSVDGAPIATTKATRARLVGLRPDAKYQVKVKSGPA